VVVDMMSATPDRKSGGFVQILVLVSLTGIGAVVTASVIESMTGNRAAAALRWAIESDALAGSTFNRISDAVANPADALELSLIGDEQALDLGIGMVSAAVESESSKVNLMLADLAILHRYAINAGLSSTQASAFVAGLGEARKVRDATKAFDTLLLHLVGSRSYSDLASDFTVVGTSAGVDPAYATLQVLSALPDLSPAQVQLLESTPASGRAYAVSSKFFASGGSRYSMVATIRKGAHQSQRRLVVQVTTSGRMVPVRP
jgi:hypothetical protein